MRDHLAVEQVIVAIPAHDEEELLERCLLSVIRSVGHAFTALPDTQFRIGVSAHRCTDRTFETAERVLAAAPGIAARVVRDEGSNSVGGVRRRLIRELVSADMPPSATWVLSTDADSVVPPDWVIAMLGAAADSGAVAVAGMTELIDWEATPEERAAYAEIIERGLTPDGGHTHVYAANLAVRLDAYLEAGGFPSVPHGEEHALVAAIRARGHIVATPHEPRVRTSGRMPGRATHGLGELLAGLHHRAAAHHSA